MRGMPPPALLAHLLASLEGPTPVPRGARLLVAVSGGADSVSLLHGLHYFQGFFGWELHVLHLDHGLRGADSAADARWVRELCAGLALPCHTARAQVRLRARRQGLSLEMAARAARRQFFAAAARALEAPLIALGHTADDQDETLILNLARGAGLAGLSGYAPIQDFGACQLLRPLLTARHAEAVAFLERCHLTWREDASNRDPRFLRNRVRHAVLPRLERELNPRLRPALARARTLLAADSAYLENLTAAAYPLCRAPGRPPGLRVAPWPAQPEPVRRRPLLPRRHQLHHPGPRPAAPP
ncbi:MAG: tRNA lysidine(34) synthetase TilS, partial [Candidatus Marinimicrobia bacterium]|nr:tRNA lysidine(34) synthetase TilS [Candidatus Neomarinimicrobiota bacterium]